MISETEGIVLRQVKAANGRRLVTILSKNYGKISVGASVSEGGKQKSSLIISPFSYGKYQLYKGREIYNLNGGQLIKSFFSISEDYDKYMACAYVFELTDKLLPEDFKQAGVFRLLLGFLGAIEKRKQKYDTLVIVYIIKLLSELGTRPEMDVCACCGKDAAMKHFSVEDGGMLCEECLEEKRALSQGQYREQAQAKTQAQGQGREERQKNGGYVRKNADEDAAGEALPEENEKKRLICKTNSNEALIFCVNFGIVDIFRYCEKSSFGAFEKIALDDGTAKKILELLMSFVRYHFGIGRLKCEDFTVV